MVRRGSGWFQSSSTSPRTDMIDDTPRSKRDTKVLLLEGINDSAVETLLNAGYSKVERLAKALDANELRSAIANVHLLGTRSRTQLTREILGAGRELLAVGC